ncbi:MAG: cation-transporting P-type ATPase [Epulopiscium sp.]|jgi:Ca2+-transporting ATPase|nr:cation-transporting P-type ATPase [Candidatus Epulonipiscium sp.]
MSSMSKEELMRGLSDLQVNDSKAKYGTNELAKKETESLWSMFIGAFDDIWIKVLCAALVLKIVLAVLGVFVPALTGENDVIEIISILLAIALATGFSTLSEYRNTTRSEALQEEYSKTFAKVMRNGKLVNILTSEIVKGDTILVQAGDKIPVDGLVFEGNIKVSQAVLNGESRDENKSATLTMDEAESTDYSSTSKVFMGSVVTAGEAYMIATVIGDASELGKINKSLTDNNEEEERKDTSSLKLEVVAAGIGKLGVSAATIAGALHVVLSLTRATSGASAVSVILLVAEAVMLMASIVIMAVPEGLPMMNSLVQSMNTESMYKKNILVSHKAAFSDSAYMNILFSDKTGTLTQGNLSLVEFITGAGKIVDNIQSREFIEAITLNNLAKISEGKSIGSNNMDRALLTYALQNGYDDSKNDPDRVDKISGFDSEKKCATASLKNGIVYWKGATENIIDQVTHYALPDGEEREFTSADKKAVQEQMIAQAKRTMKLLSVVKIANDKTVLLAVLCLRDNVRADAVETVKILNSAGIQVVMVTGDAEETAVAIAKETGILKNEATDVVLTHEQLERMSDEELKEKLPNLRVVSRAKPLDKKRLVTISQQLDNVCGMTGDGVNDAPALKQADIGFSMGDSTAVAQEAGDVVILNNSLTSIKDCVLNSRTMAKSVGKFLIFQLTVNISTLLMNIIAPILGWTEPFSIVQILWINLIMDTLAAMAFGSEPILNRYMEDQPAKRTDNILTTYIKSAIGTSSIFITLGSILILENIAGITSYVTPADCADPELYKKTFMFAFFIYSIIFNSLNTRSERFNLFEHIGENKNFMLVMGAIFILQTIIIEIGGSVFSTTTLDVKALLVSMALAILIIPVDMVRKAIIRK